MFTITDANVKALGASLTELVLVFISRACLCSMHWCIINTARRAAFGHGLVRCTLLFSYLTIHSDHCAFRCDLKLRTSTKLLEPSDDSTLGLSLKLDFNPPDLGRDLLTFLLPFFFMIMTFWMKCI